MSEGVKVPREQVERIRRILHSAHLGKHLHEAIDLVCDMALSAPGQQEAALDFQQESPEAEAWRLEREGRLPAPAEKPSDEAESTKTP